MALNTINDLNNVQLDTLKEIGNIGQGHAASALSSVLNEEIDVAVPEIKILEFNDVVNYLGGPENIAIGLFVALSGEIDGMMLCIMQKDFVDHIVQTMFNKQAGELTGLGEMDMSFVTEVGNIQASSYINAIASLAGLNVNLSVPHVTVDMVGAILSVPAVHYAHIGDKVLFIDDSFIVGDKKVKSNMILVPELSSLKALFSKLGVEI